MAAPQSSAIITKQVLTLICCCCSVPQLCPTLWDPMDCGTPGLPVLHRLPELLTLTSTELGMPATLSSCPRLLLPSVFPSIRVFSNESALHIKWPKYWSVSISPSNEYSELISFKIDWFDLAVQGPKKQVKLSMLWRRRWHPTPVLLPRKSHGQRSLVGCSPWGCEESDMTERLPFQFSLSCIGEGNGNPLQYSYLENPRDRGAWWAAVYGVAQSRTRLKRLRSNSSKPAMGLPWGHTESDTTEVTEHTCTQANSDCTNRSSASTGSQFLLSCLL